MLLRDACAAIRSAASDERVVGLVAQLGAAPGLADASLAQCQELSGAVAEFRAKKPQAVTIAHADSLGGLPYPNPNPDPDPDPNPNCMCPNPT